MVKHPVYQCFAASISKKQKNANGIQGQGLRLSPIRIQDNPQSAVFKVTQDKGGIGRAKAEFSPKKERKETVF